MAFGTGQRAGLDRSLISLSTPWEVQYWTDQLGVTEHELKAAVRAVGLSLKAIKAYVAKPDAAAQLM